MRKAIAAAASPAPSGELLRVLSHGNGAVRTARARAPSLRTPFIGGPFNAALTMSLSSRWGEGYISSRWGEVNQRGPSREANDPLSHFRLTRRSTERSRVMIARKNAVEWQP